MLRRIYDMPETYKTGRTNLRITIENPPCLWHMMHQEINDWQWEIMLDVLNL